MAMRPECRTAVNQAAEKAGLKPRTAAQIDAIDTRLRATMRELARTDPDWQAKSTDERLQAAAEQAIAAVQAEAARKVENAQRQILKTAATTSRIDARPTSRTASLVRDIEEADLSIKGIRNESLGNLMALMDAVTSTDGVGAGRRIAQFLFDADNPVMRRDLANEIFKGADGSTGNVIAKEGAAAYLKVAEDLRTRFNAAGGDVGKLDYGYLTQPWDASKVRKAGRERFVDKVLPTVDRKRMVNEDGSLMSDGQVREFLASSFDTLSTEGLNKRDPGKGPAAGSGARANRGGEARQIHFKDGDAWLAVMDKFGRGSMYEAISGHVSGMARDIGLVERYGPNPNAQFRLQLDLTERADGEVGRSFLQRPETYWDVVSGVTATPQSARIAQIGMTARAMQTGAKLGGAVLSSITDVGTYAVTTGFNRLSYWDSIANIGKVAASKETRDFLTTHGIIAESMAGDLNRWAGDNTAQNWAGRLANSTLKLSLLNAWTDTLRRGFQMTMMQGLARMSKKAWGELDGWDRALMERRGFTEDDWKVLTKAQLTEFGGKEHLTPEAIRAGGGDGALVAKVLGLIQDEGETAVINPDLATRAATTFGGTQAGTIRGELARSVMQFKAFPLAMVSRHWRRMLDAPQVADGSAPMLGNRLVYTGALLATTTALGAIALQAKQVVQGKDPIDMTGKHAVKFWLKAVAQGGGLSIVGDLLLNDPSDSPGGMAGAAVKTALGPVLGSFADVVLKLGAENVWQAAEGKKTHAAAEALAWAKSNAPLVNIWYLKAVVDHMGLQALQENLSPGYLAKMKQKAQKDWDQSFWWEPGTGAPARPPNLPAAGGR